MSDGNKGNKEREMEIFNRFSRIVKEHFTSLAGDGNNGGTKINQLDVLYKQPEFTAEKRILNEMNSMGLYKGVMGGLACFALLRFSPRAMSRMLQRRAGVGTGGGTVSPFNQSSGYKFDQPTAAQQPNGIKPPGLMFRLVRLSLDTFVSLSIGAYLSLYFVDKDRMMRQFADIPLIEGRSLLSEELCEDFTKEFQNFDPRTWDRNQPSLTGGAGGVNSNDSGVSDFRNTIQGFVANCRRRAICEEELRRERGMRDSEPVVIPSGGVPRDISVSLDDLLGSKEYRDGSVQSGDDYFKQNGDGTQNGDDFFDTYFDADDDNKD